MTTVILGFKNENFMEYNYLERKHFDRMKIACESIPEMKTTLDIIQLEKYWNQKHLEWSMQYLKRRSNDNEIGSLINNKR